MAIDMRMRRKKHLDEKIAKCDNLIMMPSVKSDYREEVKVKDYIDFTSVFGNNKPLIMEIGCGKGGFICELAKRDPDFNYIAVEVNPNVLCGACELAKSEGVNNISTSIFPVLSPKKPTKTVGLQTRGSFVFIKKYCPLRGKSTRKRTICTFLSIRSFSILWRASSLKTFLSTCTTAGLRIT